MPEAISAKPSGEPRRRRSERSSQPPRPPSWRPWYCVGGGLWMGSAACGLCSRGKALRSLRTCGTRNATHAFPIITMATHALLGAGNPLLDISAEVPLSLLDK